MSPQTPPLSPRITPSQPSITHSATLSTAEKSTIWNIIFAPGGSSLIRDNLIDVYEHKDSRFYCAYLTGITALRSGIEIIPSAGILLLNTVFWFITVTRPRREVITIVTRDFADIIHCIKMFIALPFFAVAGLIFPSDVFGLFEHLPADPTKISLANERTALTQVIAIRKQQEEKLAETKASLESIKQELDRTDDALTTTKTQLDDVQKKIKESKDAETKAKELEAENTKLSQTVKHLRDEETKLKTVLENLQNEINKLAPALHAAKESHDIAITSLKDNLSNKEGELKRVQTELKQALEQQKKAKQELDNISEETAELRLRAVNLQSEIKKLEETKPTLVETEKTLTAAIAALKSERAQLETRLNQETEIANTTLNGLTSEIRTQEAALDDLKNKIEKLERERNDVDSNRQQLHEECRGLKYTTLPDLQNQQTVLEDYLKALNLKKESIESEIAGEKAALETEKLSIQTLAKSKHELEKSIHALMQQEHRQKDTLVNKERDIQEAIKRKESVENDITAQQEQLKKVTKNVEDTNIALKAVVVQLQLKTQEKDLLAASLTTLYSPKKAASSSDSSSTTNPSEAQTEANSPQVNRITDQVTQLSSQKEVLTLSVMQAQAELDSTTKAVDNLTKQSQALAGELKEQQKEATELPERLSKLKKEIQRLEEQEKTLKEEYANLDTQISTSKIAIEKLTTEHTELKRQVASTIKEKETATESLKKIENKVNAAKSEKEKLQTAINNLTPVLITKEKLLADLKKEQLVIETALETLRKESATLKGEVAEAKQDLEKLVPLRNKANEKFDAEMEQLQKEKTLLEEENLKQKTALENLQKEVARLTVSTNELAAQETTLKASVQNTIKAQNEAQQRYAQETEDQKKLHERTMELSQEVQRLTKEATAKTAEQAETKRKFEEDLAVRRAAFEQELRTKQENAVKELEVKLAEIRSLSPKKALGKQNLDAIDAEITRKREELDKLNQAITEVKRDAAIAVPKLKNDILRYQKEAAEAKAQRDQHRNAASRTTITQRVGTPAVPRHTQQSSTTMRLKTNSVAPNGAPSTPTKLPSGTNDETMTDASY